MKTLMLNQKSKLKINEVKNFINNLKTYENMFTIFPSSIYMKDFIESGFHVGTQNIAEKDLASQTGEITAEQVKELGCKYVIIGHSERRINQKENKDILINKFNEAIKNNLNIIYCVGESLVEYKLKNTENFIYKELNEVLKEIKDINKVKELYIAYEPIWAIGTGVIPTDYEIEKISKMIKEYLNENSINAKILYGGSVSDNNIENLIKLENIDGFLIGGASNDYKKVKRMCEININSTK